MYMPPPFLLRSKTSWWLNQPILKKYARQIGSFPQGSGWKLTIFELPPPRKYVILYTVGKSREIAPVSWLELVHLGRKKTTFGRSKSSDPSNLTKLVSRPSRPCAFLDSLHTSKVWPFAKLDLDMMHMGWAGEVLEIFVRQFLVLEYDLDEYVFFTIMTMKPYLGYIKWSFGGFFGMFYLHFQAWGSQTIMTGQPTNSYITYPTPRPPPK